MGGIHRAHQFDQPGEDIGLHIKIAFLVDPVDLCQLGHGGAGDEVRQRHQPIHGAHLQRVQRAEHTVFLRQAHPDLDLFVRTVDPHRVQQQPAGDQLYHCADGDHISPVLPRLGDIHVDLPVDAGQGAGVFDQGQAGGFLEGVTGLCRRGDQVSETVGFQTQMHRLARRRAARLCKDFDLDAGDRAQRFRELCDHDVAVQFRAQGAVFPRDGFKLHLTDAVLGGLRPAGIAVEPALTSKGKGGRDTGMRQHDRLRLLHDRVFFRQRQVAPCQHIDDRLLGFGFDKEFHAFAVVAKEDHRGADKDKDDPRDHQRHHRIARDKGNEPPEA